MGEQDTVVDVRAYAKEREQEERWETLAKRLATNDAALERFCDFMNTAVGHPDVARRNVEGLPLRGDFRGGEQIVYDKEICSMIDTRGTVLHVREISEQQRWQECIRSDYDYEKIFLRGKNYFVFSGNLFNESGLDVYPVAQHDRVVTSNSRIHRIQALPPQAFNQPWIPIYRPDNAPYFIEIIQTPASVSACFVGDRSGHSFRQLDASTIDQITRHITVPETEPYTISS
ncbi:MAG: hypothetical protein ABIQ64_03905 [Candidatus Saccharimonadales bacterium]